jgi:hypothetical protein
VGTAVTDAVPFDHRLQVPEHVATRELDGELVLLNYDSETYFGLDEIGTRMLEVLRTSPSIDAGVDQLLAEFDVEPARLREDVRELLRQLVDGGLVELVAV